MGTVEKVVFVWRDGRMKKILVLHKSILVPSTVIGELGFVPLAKVSVLLVINIWLGI